MRNRGKRAIRFVMGLKCWAWIVPMKFILEGGSFVNGIISFKHV